MDLTECHRKYIYSSICQMLFSTPPPHINVLYKDNFATGNVKLLKVIVDIKTAA